jgi:ISXO2-like transposase domain
LSYSDGWRGYNGLVDVGYNKHLRVDHSNEECAKGRNHSIGIEGFRGHAKTRLVHFHGMAPSTLNLHLKECEFMFNLYRLGFQPFDPQNFSESTYKLVKTLKIIQHAFFSLNGGMTFLTERTLSGPEVGADIATIIAVQHIVANNTDISGGWM